MSCKSSLGRRWRSNWQRAAKQARRSSGPPFARTPITARTASQGGGSRGTGRWTEAQPASACLDFWKDGRPADQPLAQHSP
eukprot:1602785-Alexandrium_andersonii.AAC.1